VAISKEYVGAETDGTIAGVESDEKEGDGRLGAGAIIGISLSILVCSLILCIAARDRLRKPEGGEFPAADAEDPPPAADGGPRQADEAVDESRSEHSLWLDSDADEDKVSDVDVDSETKVSAVSSLAAMGAASTVAANLIAPTTNSRR
jgi:hypothetical protein